MHRVSDRNYCLLISLRRSGKSIIEISKETGISKTTVQRYVKSVDLTSESQLLLRGKRGGSKVRAKELRDLKLENAAKIITILKSRDLLFLLIGLYWGEGTKKDFSIINSDPYLIQSFIICLKSIGVDRDRLSMSLRVHKEIPVAKAKMYWAHTTGISIVSIRNIEIVEGNKKGKLPYGMCRIRVLSGIKERLLIQSAITLIGKDSYKKLVSQ